MSKDDLLMVIYIINSCFRIQTEEDYHRLIRETADYLGFQFILYCYCKISYSKGSIVNIINISNPADWMLKYQTCNYMANDPVRIEMELKLQHGIKSSFIKWDSFDRELSRYEIELINERCSYGLNHGFSVYQDSSNSDFTFLISFADRNMTADSRMEEFMLRIINHMTAARKRLDIVFLYNTLTDKEKLLCEHLLAGKSNIEISNDLNIAENTVKYHMQSVCTKLGVLNRQQATAAVMTGKYLNL
ncbi:MAG: helix-turn-helix transcriptional regulator [Deferribacterales bacterium]